MSYPSKPISVLSEALIISGLSEIGREYSAILALAREEGVDAAINKLQEDFPDKSFPCICDRKNQESCKACSKSNILSAGAGKQYLDTYLYLIDDRMNRLKGHTLNSIESLGLSDKQESAIKDLFRSISNETHDGIKYDITEFITKQEWITKEQRIAIDRLR